MKKNTRDLNKLGNLIVTTYSNKLPMHSFPELYTPRLTLRKIQIDDIPSLIKYANNRIISDRIVNIPYPYREPEAVFRIGFVSKGFKEKTRYVFAIILKETNEMIGEISLHILDKNNHHGQLGYWLGEPFWNQGITTEAAKAVIEFGFKKVNFDLIFATCNKDNIASEKVLISNGMRKHAQNVDMLTYTITRLEYMELV